MTESLRIDLPDWARPLEDSTRCFSDDTEKMRFAIDLARRNVEAGSGGPFGAAVFERATGRLLSVGVNSVVRLESSVLHAEMLALMRAQQRLGSYTLHRPGEPEYELFSSCEPCAMCLGGILWSGVRRLVCGAGAVEARAIGFDEGPVFAESYRHLEQAGIVIRLGLLADEASAIIRRYRERGGPIYNG
jgi:tRNA(Arg) A34 adenosine deaminase TadA